VKLIVDYVIENGAFEKRKFNAARIEADTDVRIRQWQMRFYGQGGWSLESIWKNQKLPQNPTQPNRLSK